MSSINIFLISIISAPNPLKKDAASKVLTPALNENGLAIAVAPDRIKKGFMAARAADELLNISGINVCFVLAEINSDIIISGRSNGDVNVQVILEAIGGGGHMNMAGAKVNGTIDEVVYMLKEAIKKHLEVKE